MATADLADIFSSLLSLFSGSPGSATQIIFIFKNFASGVNIIFSRSSTQIIFSIFSRRFSAESAKKYFGQKNGKEKIKNKKEKQPFGSGGNDFFSVLPLGIVSAEFSAAQTKK
jgi:hypothetical protein